MSITKTYDNSRELFEDTWKYGSDKQKRAWLKASGSSESWSKTKSVDEMVKRGGGLTARQLGRIIDKYLESKGGSVTITWSGT